jgi:hypothetical protein
VTNASWPIIIANHLHIFSQRADEKPGLDAAISGCA